ncbi:alpha/beta hydrolase family protein [Inhella gelatinilytica]|uniref:S9 family peptidase n=1 Tax=Inhella gelatinilytica TaxID=2795030 RepID=A0A931IZ06_9BURK|nr:prolyl oligopeptidase family serine peptidase [Inhella gelatinilytica]MBH9553605.1 S9 family peptidase [Inhella gelatinilytica]
MHRLLTRLLGLLGALWLLIPLGHAEPYRQPAPATRAALDAPLPARTLVSPDRRWLALITPRRYTPLAELARPQVKLAGARFDPQAHASALGSAALVTLRLRPLMDPQAAERVIALPPGGAWHGFAWAPDGRHYILMRRTLSRSELWWGETAGGEPQLAGGIALNLVLWEGDPVWLSATELVVPTVVPSRAPAPALPGPQIQDHHGRGSPERTLPDLLRNEQDDALFEHHARSQLMAFQVSTGARRRLGEPGLFTSVAVAGRGQALLTERMTRPFSRHLAWDDFPQVAEVRDRQGRVLRELARLPSRAGIPIDGVIPGPRVFYASPTDDAAVYWVEALDSGPVSSKSSYRDRVMRLDPPYRGDPVEVQRMPYRFSRLRFLENGQHALLTETDRSRAITRTYLLPLDGSQSRLLFEHPLRERFRHPGSPLMRTLPHGGRVVAMDADREDFWFVGSGAGPKGERPFLDRYGLRDHPIQRVFHAPEGSVEMPIGWVDERRLLTQVERGQEPAQLGVREGSTWRALLPPRDFGASLRTIKRQYLSFKRDDGVELSAWLLLPPDHQDGQKRATLIWAYPREFTDGELASQAAAYSELGGLPAPGSPVWLALEGYAVVVEATMPVVGDSRTVNDGFIEQIQLNAKALVDQLRDVGSVDVSRLAIGGQSYGAYMAVNLLAHTQLFKVGIARAGAYNRTLTPFGFQSERRSLWEARDAYLRASPFLHAERIKEPLLLIHGEQDPNPGTPVLQSERLYHALAGLGQTARLVVLPLEGHSLASREAAGQVQWEMQQWLRRHLGPPLR